MKLPIDQIVHGDCIDVLRSLPAESVDAIVTDPPYGVGWASTIGKVQNDGRPFIWWLAEAYRVLKSKGAMVCFSRWDVEEVFRVASRAAGFKIKGQLIWDRMMFSQGDLTGAPAPQHDTAIFATKGRFAFAGPRLRSVQQAMRVAHQHRTHPTEKPVGLLRPIIEALVAPDGIVLDPFSGSGAVAVAAAGLGRRFVSIEIDGAHVTRSRARLVDNG